MTVMLVVDLSASERFGTRRAAKVRVASEVAALLAFSAIRNNDRVGLIVATDRVERIVPPKKGEKHVMRVVREILGFEPKWSEGAAPRIRRERPDAARRGDEPARRARVARARLAAAQHRVHRERLLRQRATSARWPSHRPSTTSCRWCWSTRATPSFPTWAWRASRTSRAARASSSTRAIPRVRAWYASAMKRIAESAPRGLPQAGARRRGDRDGGILRAARCAISSRAAPRGSGDERAVSLQSALVL